MGSSPTFMKYISNKWKLRIGWVIWSDIFIVYQYYFVNIALYLQRLVLLEALCLFLFYVLIYKKYKHDDEYDSNDNKN